MSVIEDAETEYIYKNEIEAKKPEKLKQLMRIQYKNQNLDQAVKQVKLHMKQQKLEKNKLPNPQVKEQSDANNLFFTETFRKRYNERLKELDMKKKQLNAKNLSKQMNVRLAKKIKDNIELKNKMQLLKDIQEKKNQNQIEKLNKEKRQNQQKKMLHETSLDNIKMLRKNKLKTKKKQMKQSRIIEQQSLKDLRFKSYLNNKEKQQHQMILKNRHQFMIRVNSNQNFREDSLTSRSSRSSLHRTKTSHNLRKKLTINKEDDEDLIIEQYTPKQVLLQKKFNQGARTFQEIQNNEQKEESLVEDIDC